MFQNGALAEKLIISISFLETGYIWLGNAG